MDEQFALVKVEFGDKELRKEDMDMVINFLRTNPEIYSLHVESRNVNFKVPYERQPDYLLLDELKEKLNAAQYHDFEITAEQYAKLKEGYHYQETHRTWTDKLKAIFSGSKKPYQKKIRKEFKEWDRRFQKLKEEIRKHGEDIQDTYKEQFEAAEKKRNEMAEKLEHMQSAGKAEWEKAHEKLNAGIRQMKGALKNLHDRAK
ncbi:MAG: hypothetical protein GF333_06960 [Candidatus Omnitrophica bacterium]|nr:hypothetical protein [Candidatus Omnitrophota bacterium]